MKITHILLSLSLLASQAAAQVVQEHQYSNPAIALNITSFTDYGDRYYSNAVSDGYIKLYDLGHNLWKTITPPAPPANYTLNALRLLSDKLVNGDNLIEYFAVYSDNTAPSPYPTKVIIYNESGAVLHTFNDLNNLWVNMLQDGTYKLIGQGYNTGGGFSVVYSVPGSLPCVSCAGLKVGELSAPMRPYISETIPNPNNGSFIVNYSLPAGYQDATLVIYDIKGVNVGRYDITNRQSSISLDLSLPAGNYLLSIISALGESDTRQFVIVK